MRLKLGRNNLPADILERFEVSELAVVVPGLARPLAMRVAETDADVFHQIFEAQEYDLRLPDEAAIIVDAGANVGYSVAWFRLRFPAARIIAIEPDPANFAMLERNCGDMAGVTLIRGALWSKDTTLELRIRNGAWATQTVAAPDGDVTAFTLDSLMAEYGLDTIDILKVDIEGAEKEVFEAGGDWVERTRCIVVETHDRFRPGAHRAVRDCLGSAFEAGQRGENEFYWRRGPWPPGSRAEPRKHHVWIVSDARSGSTWLADLVNHGDAFASYFEPTHVAFNPALAGEPLLPYLRPGSVPPLYADLYRQVFSRELDLERIGPDNPQRWPVLVKDIHSLLSARAISSLFPAVKVVCLVRDPVEVAVSKLAREGWLWAREPRDLLALPGLRDDWLRPFVALIFSARTQFEKYVAIWCVSYHVFLRQFDGADVAFVRYEAVKQSPRETVTEMMRDIRGFDIRPDRFDAVVHRASQSSAELTGEPYRPTAAELDFAAAAIERFGLGDLLGHGTSGVRAGR